MKLTRPRIVTDGGPWAEHDMACSVCHNRHAVLAIDTGVFHPCWRCQKDGWTLVQARPAVLRWLIKILRGNA